MPIPSQLPRAPLARRRNAPEPPSTNAVGSSTGISSTGTSGGIVQRHARVSSGTAATPASTHSTGSTGARKRTVPYAYAAVNVTLTT